MKVSKIILNLYMLLFLLLVFCGNDQGIFAYVSEIMALSGVLLILGRCVSKREFGLPINKGIPLLFIVIFIFIVFDYKFWSMYPQNTFVFIKRYIFYMPIVFISISVESIEKIIECSKKYLLLIAFVFVIKYPSSGINGSFLGTYQEVGGAISLGLLFYIADIIYNEKYTYKNVFAFLFLVATILMTGKRSFTVIPLLLLVISLLIKSKEFSYKNKIIRVFKILFPAILLGSILLAIKPEIFSTLLRLAETSQDEGMNGRKNFWELAIYLWNNNKLLGIGFATYNEYIKNNLDFTYDFFNVQKPWAAHNIYYQLLAEAGTIGFMLHILFFSYNLITTIKCICNEEVKKNSQISKCVYISLLIQIWFILYGYTGNPLYMINQYYIYLFATMMLQAVKRKIRNQGNE